MLPPTPTPASKFWTKPLFQNTVALLLQITVGIGLVREIIRTVGPTRYGQLSFAFLVISFSSLLDGLRNLLTKQIHDEGSLDQGRIPPLLRGMDLFNLLLALLSVPLVFLLLRAIQPSSPSSDHLILAVTVGAMVAQAPYCASMMAQNLIGAVSLLRAFYWYFAYLGIWVLARQGYSHGVLITSAAIWALALTLAYRAWGFRGIPAFGPIQSNSLPLFISLIAQGLTFNALSGVLGFADRLMLAHYGSRADYGVYAVLYDLGAKGVLLGSVVSSSFFPTWSKCISESDFQGFRRHFQKAFIMVLIAMALGCFVVCLKTPFVLRIWAPGVAWRPSDHLAFRLIVSTAALQGIGSLAAYALIAARKVRAIIKIYALTLAATLVAGPLLVRHYGVLGAACINLLSRAADPLMILALYWAMFREPSLRESNQSR